MPQLSKSFDAYPQTITLDANGNGTVAFQPNGSHINITRLFVQVSSAVKQASVTIYKGLIAPSKAIATIVSGSTGGLASGNIYVQDGSILYVVWTGGDVGATATATFSGNQIQFSEMGNDSITWTDPIAASDGSLVFPAIRSINYVPGSTGWIINRDGSFELGSGGTIRGNVQVKGSNGSIVDISTVGAFASMSLTPPTWTVVPGVTNNPARIQATRIDAPNIGISTLVIQSPNPNTTSPALISMSSSTLDGTSQGSTMGIGADDITLTGDTRVGGRLFMAPVVNGAIATDQGKGLLVSVSSIVDSAAVTAGAEAIVLTLPSAVFGANRAYEIKHSGAASLAVAVPNNIVSFQVRKTNLAGVSVTNLGRIPLIATQVMSLTQSYRIFTVGATAVTTVLVLTMTTPGGSTSGAHNGSAAFPRQIGIYDIGAASDYPNAPVLS